MAPGENEFDTPGRSKNADLPANTRKLLPDCWAGPAVFSCLQTQAEMYGSPGSWAGLTSGIYIFGSLRSSGCWLLILGLLSLLNPISQFLITNFFFGINLHLVGFVSLENPDWCTNTLQLAVTVSAGECRGWERSYTVSKVKNRTLCERCALLRLSSAFTLCRLIFKMMS